MSKINCNQCEQFYKKGYDHFCTPRQRSRIYPPESSSRSDVADEEYIDNLLENYQYKKYGPYFIKCNKCNEAYTFMILHEKETTLLCDKHYIEHLKTATPERIKEMQAKYSVI